MSVTVSEKHCNFSRMYWHTCCLIRNRIVKDSSFPFLGKMQRWIAPVNCAIWVIGHGHQLTVMHQRARSVWRARWMLVEKQSSFNSCNFFPFQKSWTHYDSLSLSEIGYKEQNNLWAVGIPYLTAAWYDPLGYLASLIVCALRGIINSPLPAKEASQIRVIRSIFQSRPATFSLLSPFSFPHFFPSRPVCEIDY